MFKKCDCKDKNLSINGVSRIYMASFIKSFYKYSCISMLELSSDFIKKFAVYLFTETGLRNSTIFGNLCG